LKFEHSIKNYLRVYKNIPIKKPDNASLVNLQNFFEAISERTPLGKENL